jgi:type IV pilus assembly protein PilQ
MHKRIMGLSILILLLAPLLSHGQVLRKPAPKVSFDFMDADVRNVLRALSDISGRNMVIADEVKARVTVKLDNVSWDEAMDIIIKNNDLAMIEDGSVIRIVTSKKFLEEKEKDKKEKLAVLTEKEMREKLEDGFVTETVFLNYVDAIDVERMIRGVSVAGVAGTAVAGGSTGVRSLLTPNGSVTLVKWTNALILKDTRENVEQLKKRIKEHDLRPAQVQIEARIVQASTTVIKDIGVQWGASYTSRLGGQDYSLGGGKTAATTTSTYTPTVGQVGQRSDGSSFPYNVNLPAAVSKGSGGILGVYIGNGRDSLNLDVQLSALESEGRVKIISHPKVVTSDGKAAKINQGRQIPYQTVSMQGTQTQFADAYLGLEVTPQVVLRDGTIRLKVKTTKDSADFENQTVAGPTINKREAVTEIIIRDGDTAVIGGIYETLENASNQGVPFLSKIPVIKWLFNRDYKSLEKSELLLFITPMILKNLYSEGEK